MGVHPVRFRAPRYRPTPGRLSEKGEPVRVYQTETFRVTFHYTVEVEAAHAEDAIVLARGDLNRMLDSGELRPAAEDMAVTVDPEETDNY